MGSNEGQKPYNALMRSLKELFESGLYSDLTIVCGEDRHRVHKAIVCTRSSFFNSACNSGFQEAETGIIHLHEDDPLVVKMMLHYLYHLDYPQAPIPASGQDETSTSHTFTFRCTSEPSVLASETTGIAPADKQANERVNDWLSKKEKKKLKMKRLAQPQSQFLSVPATPNLTLHAKVYAIGEKYGVDDLKELAANKFRAEAEFYWQSDDFVSAIKEVYTSTIDEDRVLRDIVTGVISKHWELLDRSSLQSVIKNLGICFDLLMRFRKSQSTTRSTTSLWGEV
ncbi:hypothetical protein CEP54_013171 [Fusarium duplospermum]|uniref:BTB domain-containing protein n=1 Tax=Fusarium duplospermum TaxID=1325734 RepID=A0A428P4I5_9HYPO|nr:hypothetical protein CEP54_013171 [Fusarium duplospermum]